MTSASRSVRRMYRVRNLRGGDVRGSQRCACRHATRTRAGRRDLPCGPRITRADREAVPSTGPGGRVGSGRPGGDQAGGRPPAAGSSPPGRRSGSGGRSAWRRVDRSEHVRRGSGSGTSKADHMRHGRFLGERAIEAAPTNRGSPEPAEDARTASGRRCVAYGTGARTHWAADGTAACRPRRSLIDPQIATVADRWLRRAYVSIADTCAERAPRPTVRPCFRSGLTWAGTPPRRPARQARWTAGALTCRSSDGPPRPAEDHRQEHQRLLDPGFSKRA